MGLASAIWGGHSWGCYDVAKSRRLDPDARPVNLFNVAGGGYRRQSHQKTERDRMIRDDIKAAQITAMKAGDKQARAAISLIQSAIKNRDIEARTGKAPEDDDALVVEVLQKMVKQRRESIEMYTKGGRQELADAEAAEVAVIERFLPSQMSDAETTAAIEAIKAELGASGMKDMGRVMAELKSRHATTLDMSKASALVKAALS
jgi:uncharacterized protein